MAAAEPLTWLAGGLPAALDHAAVEQARLVRAARAALLEQGALTYAMLADGRDTSEPAARKWVSRHRSRLVVVTQDASVLIPTFQLDAALDLRPQVGAVTEQLGGFGLDDWAVWDWWTVANGWLDGTAPIAAADRGGWVAVERAVRGLVDA